MTLTLTLDFDRPLDPERHPGAQAAVERAERAFATFCRTAAPARSGTEAAMCLAGLAHVLSVGRRPLAAEQGDCEIVLVHGFPVLLADLPEPKRDGALGAAREVVTAVALARQNLEATAGAR